jgi:hypothetical protein
VLVSPRLRRTGASSLRVGSATRSWEAFSDMNQRLIDLDREDYPADRGEQLRIFRVYQYLEGGERPALSDVHNRHAGSVPTSGFSAAPLPSNAVETRLALQMRQAVIRKRSRAPAVPARAPLRVHLALC